MSGGKPVAFLQGWARIWTRDNQEQIQLAVRAGFELEASGLLAYSRLRDGGGKLGGKSFSNKKCEKRAGAGERQGMLTGSLSHFSRRHRPFSQVVRVLFSLCSF